MKKSAAKKKKRQPENKNYSEDGNAGQSFKSMKSYILGDLDIEDGQDDSFEISSNSSASKGK